MITMRAFIFSLLLLTPCVASAQVANPRACDASAVAVGGTANNALTGPSQGFYILNPLSATDQGIGAAESLYLDPTGSAATTTGNGTVLTLQPGQTFYGVPGSGINVSVNAATSGHKFTCVRW